MGKVLKVGDVAVSRSNSNMRWVIVDIDERGQVFGKKGSDEFLRFVGVFPTFAREYWIEEDLEFGGFKQHDIDGYLVLERILPLPLPPLTHTPTLGTASPPTLDRMVFSVDPAIVELARLRYEVPEEDAETLRTAVSSLWRKALLPDYGGLPPEDASVVGAALERARELADRVGKRWDVETLTDRTPRSISEALTRGEPLVPLGFKPLILQAAAFGILESQPQMMLRRGRRLVIDGGVASKLRVMDIRVGLRSVFPCPEPVPGDMFAPTAFPLWLDTGRIDISQRVSVCVQNDAQHEIVVTGALLSQEEKFDTDLQNWIRMNVNGVYGKYAVHSNQEVVYKDTDSIVTYDRRSAYPKELIEEHKKRLKEGK